MELLRRVQKILLWTPERFLVIIYLSAIVAANLLITTFGPKMTIFTAFVFIGFDLTSRDFLHEMWMGKGLVKKMSLLIASGSVLSWVINRDAAQIATASFIAFAASGGVDFIIYHAMKERSKILKINGSNIISSAVDSIILPTTAFWTLMPEIILGQFAAKVAGGFCWSVIISNFQINKCEEE
jgi:uncharacterized PurR-regulated membrane protein YhhQ (DUF165 family)